ncbi:Elongation factor 1-gamma 1 [Paramyrothecium foliicola]|nr:Elongation factor 1-gamma 1 [Paramyrothecium foliicola]
MYVGDLRALRRPWCFLSTVLGSLVIHPAGEVTVSLRSKIRENPVRLTLSQRSLERWLMRNQCLGNSQSEGLGLTRCATALNQSPDVVLVQPLSCRQSPDGTFAVMDTSKDLAERLAVDENLASALNNEGPRCRGLSLAGTHGTAEPVNREGSGCVECGIDLPDERVQGHCYFGRSKRWVDEIEALRDSHHPGVRGQMMVLHEKLVDSKVHVVEARFPGEVGWTGRDRAGVIDALKRDLDGVQHGQGLGGAGLGIVGFTLRFRVEASSSKLPSAPQHCCLEHASDRKPLVSDFIVADNPRSTAIKAVAKANDLELNLVEVDFASVTPEHVKAHPLGKIPAFLGEDGFALSESIAIAIYIASQNEKTTLLGKTKQDYASILKWMSYANTEILPKLAGGYRPLLGLDPYNKKNVEESLKAAQKTVDVVEEHLLHNTYLVGERITLADLFAAGIISRGFQYFYDKAWRSANPNVTRWFETVVNQPIYSAVANKLEFLATPALTNVAPKKEAAPKKETPKPAPKAPAAEEEEAAPAPKPKHPIDLLPRATFPLDEWKRQYSNLDTPAAMKWFWENANFEEYSLWRVDYKYNDELTMVFMSNNLIGGFNNRLEASRKYIFGTAAVYGANNDSIIQGAFIIRGQDYKPVFDVAPDYESYEFVKLDPSKPEDRAFVEDQWGWEKGITVNGKEYPNADGKVFK